MPESMISSLSQNTDRTSISGKADKKAEEAQQGMFAALFGQMSVDTTTRSQTKQITPSNQKQKVNVPQSSNGVKLKQMEQTSSRPTADKVESTMQSFEDKTKQMMKDAFGVTDEDIAGAMEKLGFTYADLLLPNNFTQLAVELTDSGDVSGLLLNSDFTQTITQLQNLTQELQDELGLTMEDLQKLADAMRQEQNGKSQGLNETKMLANSDSSENEEIMQQTQDRIQTLETGNDEKLQPITESSKSENTHEIPTVQSEEVQMDTAPVEEVPTETIPQEETPKEPDTTGRNQNETDVVGKIQSESRLTDTVSPGEEDSNVQATSQLQETSVNEESESLTTPAETDRLFATQEDNQSVDDSVDPLVNRSDETTVDAKLQTDSKLQEPVQQTETSDSSSDAEENERMDSQQQSSRQTQQLDLEKTVESSVQKVQEQPQAEKNVHGKHETAMNHLTQGMQSQQTTMTQQTGQTAQPSLQQVDTQAMIEQISKFAKTHISLDGTTIAMQLDPENLGKIYMQASYKNGVLTAQLAAQDSAVKDALEHQISRLQENLNQQGIKVEAIEVTVASHEFEQNLEQNQQQFGQEMNQQQQQREDQPGRRNLNLNDENLQALFEDLSEDESLKAKMMLENGNSVDMTA